MRLLRHFNRHGSGVLFLGTVFLLAASASGQLRIVSFNTANNGDNGSNISPRAGMDVVLEAIGDELVNGIARPVDILALQEQRSAASTTQQIVDLLNGIYGAGTYDRGTVNPNTFGGGRVGVIYNTQTVELLGQTPVSNTSTNGAARQPMRYQFRPVGYGAQADFYVYSNHYKASTGATNESRRDVEATAVRANADALGQGAHIIYTGDYNIRTSSEAMYQTLLSSGNGQAFDPINTPGNWHNSSALRHTHTQSPYNPSNNIPELISGGLDDRFDFQLVSAEFLDSDGLAYIPGSYHAFGNNGSHSLNDYIDDSSNTALPTSVLDALSGVSDHLPVVADYQLPARMEVAVDSVPTRVLAGAPFDLSVHVTNVADVMTTNGADTLNYTVTTSGALSGTIQDSDAPLGGGNTHVLTVNTSLPGDNSGDIHVNSSSQQAEDASFSQSVDLLVLSSSNASFSGAVNQDTLILDFGVVVPGSSPTLPFEIHNLDDFFRANLDLDGVSVFGDDALFATDLAPFSDLAAGDSMPFEASMTDTSTAGLFSSLSLISLSDEDIPGVPATHTLALNLTGGVALPGDANLDGDVDELDFDIVVSNLFTSEIAWGEGDFNFDQVVDLRDLHIWNENKFTSLSDLVAVPEPTFHVLAISAFLGGLWRRRR